MTSKILEAFNLCKKEKRPALLTYTVAGDNTKKRSLEIIKSIAQYADIIELVLYNSGLSGISLEGKEYFYSNPLRMVNNSRDYDAHADVTESPVRQPYLECFCCPPNLVSSRAT